MSILTQAQQGLHRPPCPDPSATQAGVFVGSDGQTIRQVVALSQPRVVVLEGVLSPEECEALMAGARERLQRSQTVDTATGGSQVDASRTSQGMFYERGENAWVQRIEQRLSEWLNWPVDHGEGLQILRYGVGAEYRPHYDFFDPDRPGTPAVLARGGQRLATVVMYLNDVAQGGATVFPDIGLEVAARQGSAVFFSYAQARPDSGTLHGGAPVLAGEKWVATKWLRERTFN